MRKMWPRLLFTMLLTACLLPEARGQFLPAAHHFRAYTTADGLPDNQIPCLLQDAQGFAWIGTSQGLSCFDGVQFVNYYKESDNPNSLPSNHTNGMILLPDSNLVIATRFGLALLNPAERRFRRIAMPSAPEMAHINNNINTLHFTRRKELVVGHNAGFCVFDSNMQLRYDYLHFKAADLDKQTMGFSHAFLPLSNGDVAIRGWQGSWLYVAEKHTVIPLDPGSLADRVLGPSNFLGGETPFLCWEYFPKTITLCEPGSGRSGTTDIEDSISREMHWTTKIRLVNDTLMGFTGCNFGFRTASIDSATLRIRFSKQAIFTDRFFKDFMLDREGRWWLASNQGLLVQSLNRGHFRRVDLPQIRQDKDYNPTLTGFTKAGNYFIVAQPNYLHLYDARFRLLTSTRFQPEEMNIWGVVSNQAEMADIWSSTGWKRTPLQSLEKSKPDWKRIGPPLPTLWQLKDSRGTIWTGTATGLFKYHPSEGDSLFLENEGPHGKFPRQGASRIIETDSGYIWMCGLPGLTRWNPYAAKFDRYHPKLPGAEQEEGFPSAMVDNGDGELLVVLQNNGLWRWNTRSNQSQKLDFAAPVLNSVLDIFPDSRPKHYWLLLKSGFALMEANTLKYRYYTIPDGLPEKNRIIDIYLDRSTDSLYLGFEDQILIAGRNDLDFSNHPNTVYITEVQKMLSGQKMSFSVPFTLSPSDQDLSVFFSSPETERGNQLIFEYRLNEGNWQKIGSARSIRLINLAPGRYQLAVRALTPEGLSGPPAEVHFEVLPRFFQTWWFLTGIAGVVFLLIYSYFNRQLRQVKKTCTMR